MNSISAKSNFNFPSDKLSFKEQNFSKQTLLDIKKYDVIDKIKSDPRIESILRKHTSFLKIKPLSPISTSPERVNISLLSTPIDLIQKNSSFTLQKLPKDPRISSKSVLYKKIFPSGKKNSNLRCNYHENIPTSKPYLDPNIKHVSKIFKGSKFPNFDKSGDELLINNTEIPLFSYETANIYSNSIKSCEIHIFSPPREPCNDCMQMNVNNSNHN